MHSTAGIQVGASMEKSRPRDLRKSVSDGTLPLPSPRTSQSAVVPVKKPRTTDSESRIKVVVRKRPLSSSEQGPGILQVVPTPAGSPACLAVHEPKVKVDMTAYTDVHHFLYDCVFDEQSSNALVYAETAAPLISRIFAKGQSSTCFAYGATGSGKTFTMMGSETEPGMYLLAAADIFSMLALPQHKGLTLNVSSFEIYGGKIFDLFAKGEELGKSLPIREDGKKKMHIVGLSESAVPSLDAFNTLLLKASEARRTAETLANADSSRSHAVLQLTIKRPPKEAPIPEMPLRTPRAGVTRAEPAAPGGPEEVGRFAFIDLAGTERGADTLNCENKDRRLEGAEINKSLLALKECIRGLDKGQTHIPFRGSKLTEVLRDSFIGDCHTVMIGAVSPCIDSVEQTLNTLRYADRVRDFSSSSKGNSAPAAATAIVPPASAFVAPAPVAPLRELPVVVERNERSGLPSPTPRLSRQASAPVTAAPAPKPSNRRLSITPAAAAAKSAQAPPPPPPPPPPPVAEEAPEHPQARAPSPTSFSSPLLTSPVKVDSYAIAAPPAALPPSLEPPADKKERPGLGGVLPFGLLLPGLGSLPAPPSCAESTAEPPAPPSSLRAPKAKVAWGTMEGRAEHEGLTDKENCVRNAVSAREAGAAIFGAHREFITQCVEQLEVHTWMLSQAEANEKLMEGASLDATEAATGRAESLVDYVASLEALLIERQAALATLQAQVQSYKHAVEAAP